MQWYKTGDPVYRKPAETIEEKLIRRGWDVTESGCWEVRGGKHPAGYGKVSHNNVTTSTHRLAYEAWVGPIPEGLLIRHRCDNPPCINPDHLETGTLQDNARDMAERGRASRLYGEDSPSAKLNWSLVREIRGLEKMTLKAMSELYGVSPVCIRNVRLGLTWKENKDDDIDTV